jgi:hypothetical protein
MFSMFVCFDSNDISGLPEINDRIEAVKECVDSMPTPNRNSLKQLVFLAQVVTQHRS